MSVTLLHVAKELLNRRFRGDRRASLLPLYHHDDLEQVQERLNGDVPPEVEELLAFGAGLEIGDLEVRWDGNCGLFAADEILPQSVTVMQDGFGNAWNVDVDPNSGAWGPVYYLCHDPPVVVFQSQSFAEFLLQVAAEVDATDGALITHVHDRATMEIHRNGGNAVSVERLIGGDDHVLAKVLDASGVGDWICDLRSAGPGDGFRWGSDDGGELSILRPTPQPVFVLQRS